ADAWILIIQEMLDGDHLALAPSRCTKRPPNAVTGLYRVMVHNPQLCAPVACKFQCDRCADSPHSKDGDALRPEPTYSGNSEADVGFPCPHYRNKFGRCRGSATGPVLKILFCSPFATDDPSVARFVVRNLDRMNEGEGAPMNAPAQRMRLR